MVREFDLDLHYLLFDATNFFTFIDSFNEALYGALDLERYVSC